MDHLMNGTIHHRTCRTTGDIISSQNPFNVMCYVVGGIEFTAGLPNSIGFTAKKKSNASKFCIIHMYVCVCVTEYIYLT